MEDFLINNRIILLRAFMMIAILSGVLNYKKYKGTAAVFFIKILCYIFIVDFLGSYSSYYNTFEILEPVYNSYFRKNYWWFTLFFDVGAVLLIVLFFQKIMKQKTHKKLLKYIRVIFLFFSCIYIVYRGTDIFFQNITAVQVASALIIILSSTLYFIEVLQSNNILEFYKSVYFYIAIALFIWFIIITPISFFETYFNNVDWDFIFLQRLLFLFANFFMYTTFAIGFIVSKPETVE